MHSQDQFYTPTGYDRLIHRELSAAMEDYLEMILRMQPQSGEIGVNALAALLHVQPSSASKMVARLRQEGFIEPGRYGPISLTAKGSDYGSYLLHRHQVLCDFFCALNQSEDELEQVEQIEHYITPKTVANMQRLLPLIKRFSPTE